MQETTVFITIEIVGILLGIYLFYRLVKWLFKNSVDADGVEAGAELGEQLGVAVMTPPQAWPIFGDIDDGVEEDRPIIDTDVSEFMPLVTDDGSPADMPSAPDLDCPTTGATGSCQTDDEAGSVIHAPMPLPSHTDTDISGAVTDSSQITIATGYIPSPAPSATDTDTSTTDSTKINMPDSGSSHSSSYTPSHDSGSSHYDSGSSNTSYDSGSSYSSSYDSGSSSSFSSDP
jgi:hypothetical protein